MLKGCAARLLFILSACAMTAPAGAADTAPTPPTWGDPPAPAPVSAPAREKMIARSQDFIAVGATGCPVFLINQQVWDARQLQPTGVTLPLLAHNRTRFALSSDGSLLAVISDDPDQPNAALGDILMFSTQTGKRIAQIAAAARTGDIDFMGFVADHSLLIGSNNVDTNVATTEVWDVQTGKLSRTMDRKQERARAWTVSRDGRYAAIATDEEVDVYEIAGGQLAATMQNPSRKHIAPAAVKNNVPAFVPGFTDEPFSMMLGFAFSPDGAELAILFDHGLLCWNNHGQIVESAALKWNNPYVPNLPLSIEWSPDGKSWLLAQEYILDRQSHELVWRDDSSHINEVAAMYVDANRLLLFRPRNGEEAAVVTIPAPNPPAGKDDK